MKKSVGRRKRLPRIAASRKRGRRFSAVVAGASKGGRRIDNPPQVKNLPHNCPGEPDDFFTASQRSTPVITVQAAILHGFRNVLGQDAFDSAQIGNGARHL